MRSLGALNVPGRSGDSVASLRRSRYVNAAQAHPVALDITYLNLPP